MTVPNGPQFQNVDLPTKFFRQDTFFEKGRTSRTDMGNTILDFSLKPSISSTYKHRPDDFSTSVHLEVVHKGDASAIIYPKEYDDDWATTAGKTVGDVTNVPLFAHSVYPGYSKVSYIAGTKASRVNAMTLLGIADNDAKNEHNRTLQATSSLSKHSQKIVDKLVNSGAIKEPQTTHRNPLDFWPQNKQDSLQPNQETPVSPEKVRQGQRRVRQVISMSRNKNIPLTTEEQLSFDL